MPIGILQSSLEPGDLDRSFELASQAGAEGLALVCAEDEHVHAVLSGVGAGKVRQLKGRFGLEVPCIALTILSQTESLLGKPPVAAAARKLVFQAMEAARQIGAGIVGLPFVGQADLCSEDRMNRLIESLPELAEEAEDNGLTLGIETTLNVNQESYLLDNLGAYTSVKVCYDAATPLARRLDPATWLRDLGQDRICQVKFRDVRLGEEGSPPEWNMALGEGDVDFPAVANAMAAMGYNGWTILAAPRTADPLAAAKANVKFARELLAQGPGPATAGAPGRSGPRRSPGRG